MSAKNLWCHIQDRKLLQGFGSNLEVSSLEFIQNDNLTLNIYRIQDSSDGNQIHEIVDFPVGATLRVAAGQIDAAPTSGTFTLTFGANETSALAYGISAADLSTALNDLASITSAGGVTVAGDEGGPFRITFNNAGARSLITSDATALYPTSEVEVVRGQTGAASIVDVQLVSIRQAPVAIQTSWSDTPNAAVTVTTLQTGGTGINEVQRIKLSPAPIAGSFTLTYGSDATAAIAYSATAEDIATALAATDAFDAADISVTRTGSYQWDIEFKGDLAETDASTISGNATSLIVPKGKTARFNLGTSAAEELLNATAEKSVSLYFEIELVESGNSTTECHMDCTLINDLISGGANATPTDGALSASELNSAIRFMPSAYYEGTLQTEELFGYFYFPNDTKVYAVQSSAREAATGQSVTLVITDESGATLATISTALDDGDEYKRTALGSALEFSAGSQARLKFTQRGSTAYGAGVNVILECGPNLS